jgi:putative ATP-dependent endonuclease of OLD family
MKIESVQIQNFRAFEDETISLPDYTCLVGPNGGGKSTILCALNVFFRETENAATDTVMLSIEDFHKKNTELPVVITVTFTDLSPAAQEDFRDYYRQGKLIVAAKAFYNAETKKAEVKQFGKRLGMKDFAPFFKAHNDGEPVASLREIYERIRTAIPELAEVRTKDGMRTALSEYETANPEKCSPLWSSDEFYGVSKGTNRLSKYVQWIYVPAVKNIPLEQNETKNSALGKLLARTVRLKLKFDDEIRALRSEAEKKYRAILGGHDGDLEELQKVLRDRLGVWAHPAATIKLLWQKEPGKTVEISAPTASAVPGEGAFEGDLARLGHGFQRSYLLALLEVLTSIGDGEIPTLILGCEEPELYQHPPQAKHMAAVLEELSTKDSQVIISTHSPYFITGSGFENVRLIRFDTTNNHSFCRFLTFGELANNIAAAGGTRPTKPEGMTAKLHQLLLPEMNEIFFTKNLVLVEGMEDLATITTWMTLIGQYETFRRKGIHIVQVRGKHNLIQALAVAQGLGIPAFTIFDGDNDCEDKHRAQHERDNKSLLSMLAGDANIPFPTDTAWGYNYIMWSDNITAMMEREMTTDKYLEFKNQAESLFGQAGGLEKNALCVGTRLQLAFNAGTKPASLDRMCKTILDFCS